MTARRPSLAGAAVAVVLLALLSVPPRALANHYDVYSCYAGEGTTINRTNSGQAWSFGDNNGEARYEGFDLCGSPHSGFGAISDSGYLATPGQSASVSFTAPSGLRIEHVRLWRAFDNWGVGSGTSSQRSAAQMFADGVAVGEGFDGTRDVAEGTVGSFDATNDGIVPGNEIDVSLLSSAPQTFSYTIFCSFGQCTTGGHNPNHPGGPDERLTIYGAIVSVQDNVAPSLSTSSTGLFGGGRQRGTAPLTLTASDAAGIAHIELYAGNSSTPAFSQDFTNTSRCDFTRSVPCQNLDGYNWPIDTTHLPDGTYYVTVKAYDPAGNPVAVSSPGQVTVDNQPAPVLASGSRPTISGTAVEGGVLQVSPGSWTGSNITFTYQWQRCAPDGSGCANVSGATDSAYSPTSTDRGRTLRALVTATNPEGTSTASTPATAAVGPATASAPSTTPANGTGASDHPHFVRATHHYVTVAFGRRFDLAGRLTDATGAPIAAAQMTALSQVLGTSDWTPLGTVTTGPDGSYSLTLAPGPSRLLRIGYREHLTDPDFTSVDDTIVSVPAAVRLHTRPHRVSNHHRVSFIGRVLGGPMPAGGKQVEIQALVGREWRDVVGVRTDRAGRFRASYRFMRTFVTITYTFRALARAEGDFPYATGSSNTATVRVN